MHFSTIAIIFILSFSNYAIGQVAKPVDSSFVYAARNQAIGTYEQTLKRQAHLYEGSEYISHDPRIKIHPYYLVDSLQMGTVDYNGVHYRDVQLMYDIVRDELAIRPPDGGYRHQLRMDKVTAFSLGPHQFVWMTGDSVAGVRTGFYEIIYNGQVKALAKRQKTVQEDLSQGVYKGDYLLKDRYIIQKDNVFYEVSTKHSLLNLFPDRVKELRKYMRANQLKFKNEMREITIARVAQRYDELTH